MTSRTRSLLPLRALPRAGALPLALALALAGCSSELPGPAEGEPPLVPALDVVLADAPSDLDVAEDLVDVDDTSPPDTDTETDTDTDDAGDTDAGDTEPVCMPGEVMEVSCADGVDNDCDGGVDRADGDCWWDPAWTRRLRIDLEHPSGAEPLSDFPLLVVLDTTTINYFDTRDDGSDLRFVAADGTLLAHEIERWNEAGTSFVWVRVPQVLPDSPDDFVWLYFGNPVAVAETDPTAVWRSDFRAVYHLNERYMDETVGQPIEDATANALDGTQYQTGGDSTQGSIARGQGFGPDDLIDLPPTVLPAGAGAFTFEARASVFNERNEYPVVVAGGAIGRALVVSWISADDDWLLLTTLGGVEHAVAVPGNLFQWTNLAATYDGALVRLYVDGVRVWEEAATGPLADLGPRLLLGNTPADLRFHFDGPLDEVRFSDVARSPDWLAATHRSHSRQLVVLGPTESL